MSFKLKNIAGSQSATGVTGKQYKSLFFFFNGQITVHIKEDIEQSRQMMCDVDHQRVIFFLFPVANLQPGDLMMQLQSLHSHQTHCVCLYNQAISFCASLLVSRLRLA